MKWKEDKDGFAWRAKHGRWRFIVWRVLDKKGPERWWFEASLLQYHGEIMSAWPYDSADAAKRAAARITKYMRGSANKAAEAIGFKEIIKGSSFSPELKAKILRTHKMEEDLKDTIARARLGREGK